ncbi:hypothetical protein FRC04_008099 [Tulasnella sp. 424]|nr:hypothetical protein FRC04_008099 [Tulasnella sp. 424]KAG8974756.1 hypothetical protein FRC05_006916 [Tulasnella sp. 425]
MSSNYFSQRIQLPLISSPTSSASLPVQASALNDATRASTSVPKVSLVDAPASTFLSSVTSPLGDWLRLAAMGVLIEFARRTFAFVWTALVGMFFITVHFDDDNEAYDWLLLWLSKCDTWRGSGIRELQALTRETESYVTSDGNVVLLPDGSGQTSEKDRKIVYLPGFSTTHTFFYRGHPLQVNRQKSADGWGHSKESMTISMFGRDRKILDDLLLEAQSLFKSRQEQNIVIWQPDMLNMWRRRGNKARRPMSSIILDHEIKDTILEDARDFLRSTSWYADRGIPFRRGYLLHGSPGSGKTSLIHAIAGALNLDIYVVSLSKPGINDTTLNSLLCDLPSRSIALIEDIDAAFTRSINRDAPPISHPGGFDPTGDMFRGGGVTLSGLLNAIDGIYAQEGRILFATTNRYDVLDPALIRPGRLDMHFEFTPASSWQAREIFRCFYHASESGNSEKSLTVEERDALATSFSAGVPERFLSMASLQGYLVRYKTQPHEAAANIGKFVEAEKRKQEKHPVDWRPGKDTSVALAAPRDS